MLNFFRSFDRNTFLKVLVLFLPILAASCRVKDNSEAKKPVRIAWANPAGFPDPLYDLSRNPLTKEGVALGKMLFYDPALSRTNNISCGSCHQQKAAFSHQGQPFSAGIDEKMSKRNTPSLQNLAWNPLYFWDGGVHDLDFAPFNPIQNPDEMGETVSHVIQKLKDKSDGVVGNGRMGYPEMFKAAFGTEEINTERFVKALSQFMASMVSAGSRYDKYLAGDKNALNQKEINGSRIFEQKCSSCHAGALFTSNTFRNNGLSQTTDLGRYEVTRREADKYKFKVPGLRNISFTAPYMHDGRYTTLEDVLDHYTSRVVKSGTLDPLLIRKEGQTGIDLSVSEKRDVVSFLRTLDDDQFLKDTTFADIGVSRGKVH